MDKIPVCIGFVIFVILDLLVRCLEKVLNSFCIRDAVAVTRIRGQENQLQLIVDV